MDQHTEKWRAWMSAAPEQRQPRVRRPIMFQNWCSLSFLHWRCDAGILEIRLPPGLELDTFDEAGWIGMTPFRLTGLAAGIAPIAVALGLSGDERGY